MDCDELIDQLLEEPLGPTDVTDTNAGSRVSKFVYVQLLFIGSANVPVQVAVFPLSKKLGEPARKLADDLRKRFHAVYDDSGSIGKRYRREDEVGTPYCVTFDFDSLEDNAVTVRDRDTTVQERIGLDALADYLGERIHR